MDPQDNTFPIPPTDNSGGSIPPPGPQPGASIQPLTPAENDAITPVGMPSADPSTYAGGQQAAPTPMPAPAPVEPVAPAAPTQPDWTNAASADAAAIGAVGEQPAPLTADAASLVTPQAPGGTPAPDLSTFPTPPPAQQTAPIPGPIPAENTLDLSEQPVPAAAPTDYAPLTQEQGIMQPGVDIQPGLNSSYSATPAPTPYPSQAEGIPGMPADFGTSYNTGVASAAAMQTGKSRKPMKIILVVVAVVALLLIIGLVVVYAGRNQRKPAIELNQQNITTPTTTETTTLPTGYKLVARDCFSFGIVEQTTINFALTTCSIAAKFGATSQYSITVTPATTAVGDLAAYATSSKTGTLVSQSDTKIGGLDAKQIIQTVNGVNQQVIVVIPTGKNYTIDGKAVTGYAITTSYNDDTSRTVSDNVVSTWTWK